MTMFADVVLVLIAGALVAAGVVVGWFIAKRRALREGPPLFFSEPGPAVVGTGFTNRELNRLRDAEAEWKAERASLSAAAAEVEELRQRVGELSAVQVETERWERSLAAERAQRAALHGKMTEALRDRDRVLKDHESTVERIGALETQLAALSEESRLLRDKTQQQITEAEIARALVTTEVLDLRKRVSAREDEVVQLTERVAKLTSDKHQLVHDVGVREADRRAMIMKQQTELAERDARLGALGAEAARVEPLRAQVADREILLRAVAEERDRALATALERERELVVATDRANEAAAARRDEARSRAAAEGKALALLNEVDQLKREGDDRTGATVRAAQEIETLKREIRERDARFQMLLRDRGEAMEASLAEIGRLKEQLAAATRPASLTRIVIGGPMDGNDEYGEGDDLKRIHGIGPQLERLLHAKGITTFQQIAQWSEEDITRISAQLGAFRDRVRRDNWVHQATQLQEQHRGEPVG